MKSSFKLNGSRFSVALSKNTEQQNDLEFSPVSSGLPLNYRRHNNNWLIKQSYLPLEGINNEL